MKNQKGFSSALLLVAITTILIIGFVVWRVYTLNGSQQATSNDNVSKIEDIDNSQSLPKYSAEQQTAINEAKSVADAFFEAVSRCDTIKANSLKLIPKQVAADGTECRKQCAEGYIYKYDKLIKYDDTPVGGEDSEVAIMSYSLRCSASPRSTPININLVVSENKWYVLNATAINFL